MQQTTVMVEVNWITVPTARPEDELLAIVWISDAIKELDLDKTMDPAGRLVTGRGLEAGTGAGAGVSEASSPVVPSRSKILVRRILASPFPFPDAYAEDALALLVVGPHCVPPFPFPEDDLEPLPEEKDPPFPLLRLDFPELLPYVGRCDVDG